MFDVINQVIDGLAWSVVGFGLGYLFGKAGGFSALLESRDMKRNETPEEIHNRRARNGLRLVGIGLILLAIFSVAQAWYTINQDRSKLTCQVRFNNNVVEVFAKRVEFNDKNRDALKELAQVLAKDPSEEKRAETYQKLVDTLQETEDKRKENPIPDIPTDEC